MVKAVCMGLLADTDEQKKELKEGFEKMGFHAPEILHTFKTLPTPGEPNTGGRSDVLVGFHKDDISRLAIHPMHIGGDRLFSWHDDYVANNHNIIPRESLKIIQRRA